MTVGVDAATVVFVEDALIEFKLSLAEVVRAPAAETAGVLDVSDVVLWEEALEVTAAKVDLVLERDWVLGTDLVFEGDSEAAETATAAVSKKESNLTIANGSDITIDYVAFYCNE